MSALPMSSHDPTPKGIGDLEGHVENDSTFRWSSHDPTPKGIGDLDIPDFLQCLLEGPHTTPRRKALETRGWKMCIPTMVVSSHDPTPKGIGDM